MAGILTRTGLAGPSTGGPRGISQTDRVILGAAFGPCPPALLPGVAGPVGAAELDDLRTACAVALSRVLGTDPELVLILGAEDPGTDGRRSSANVGDPGTDGRSSWALLGPPDVSRYAPGDAGGRSAGTERIPLAHLVGGYLLRTAGWSGATVALVAGRDGPDPARGMRSVLMVLGDGSARRTAKSPGWLDPGALGYDDVVRAALASGRPDRLAALDPVLGREQLASGADVWPVAGGLLGPGRYDAVVHDDAARLGVGSVVASWLPADG